MATKCGPVSRPKIHEDESRLAEQTTDRAHATEKQVVKEDKLSWNEGRVKAREHKKAKGSASNLELSCQCVQWKVSIQARISE